MIGWYCSVGIVNGPSMPSTLEGFNFLDRNVPITISTLDGQLSRLSYDGSNYDEAYFLIENTIGTDVNSIYTLFDPDSTYLQNQLMEFIDRYFPSYKLAYPNLYSHFYSNPSTNTSIVIYIPTLKRAILARYSSASGLGFAVYSVSDELITTRMAPRSSYPTSSFFSYLRGSSNRPFLYIGLVENYNGPDSLRNSNNYYSISFQPISTDRVGVMTYKLDQIEAQISFITSLFSDNVNPDFSIIPPDNPYEPGGSSGPGGGGGTFDIDSDQISDSPLPTLSSADTGFTRLYTPTLSQVQSLARYLWTDESIVETLWNVVKRYFEDPMQAFISFSIVPVPVPVAGQEEFKVLFIPTGVMLNTVANQFVDVDCGSFELKEYYGSALDYSPNTKVSCYLPYIGTVSLNTDDVMGRTLQVKYRVDICSGSCVAKILVDGNVIYQYPGCCSVPIPFSSADFSSYGSAIISAVKTGVAVAAAGAGMPELGASVIGTDASQQSGKTITMERVETARNPKTGRQITTGTEKVTKEISGTEASLSGIAQTGVSNTANSVTASKTIVERSGSFSGNSGYLGVRRPYLIIERPRMCMPANYQQLNGFPSMITLELGSCKGFTRVQQVQLNGFYATNPEQAEILQLLKAGVIL